jgi:hypothetical protein
MTSLSSLEEGEIIHAENRTHITVDTQCREFYNGSDSEYERCQLPLYTLNTTLTCDIAKRGLKLRSLPAFSFFFSLNVIREEKKHYDNQRGTMKEKGENNQKFTQPAKGFGAGPFRVCQHLRPCRIVVVVSRTELSFPSIPRGGSLT